MSRCRVTLSDYKELLRKLQEARTTAYVLAHSYTHDSRPPTAVVDQAMQWQNAARGLEA